MPREQRIIILDNLEEELFFLVRVFNAKEVIHIAVLKWNLKKHSQGPEYQKFLTNEKLSEENKRGFCGGHDSDPQIKAAA